MKLNHFEVVVESCDKRDSHAWVRLGRTKLAARKWDGILPGQRIAIHIPPESVLLCEGHPGRVSARNVLPGHVTSTRLIPGGMRVDLDVGFVLSAVITRAAAKELRIKRGSSLFALVKAVGVAPDVGLKARFRVSLVGEAGMLSHDRIDFLRAIDRAGALLPAALDLGVTYRTAWLWANEINEIWGKPLISRTHGGKGGGGTVLTLAGRSVLALATRLELDPD